MRAPCYKGLRWIRFSSANKTSERPSSGTLCHDLVVGALYSEVKQSLGSVCVSLADFLGFICEVQHPSEADDQKRVFSLLLLLCNLTLLALATRIKWLLTGDASD